MPADRVCPQAVFVEPRFGAYTEASRAVFAVFEHTTPVVEPMSIDEAFAARACRCPRSRTDAVGRCSPPQVVGRSIRASSATGCVRVGGGGGIVAPFTAEMVRSPDATAAATSLRR